MKMEINVDYKQEKAGTKMGMKFCTSKLLPVLLSLSLCFFSSANSYPSSDDFLYCLSKNYPSNLTISDIAFTPNDTLYSSILQSTIQNLRFSTPATPKPLAIITPLTYSHVQTTVTCSVKSRLRIRIRSGGHDYEGLSYTSFDNSPFIILDVTEIRSVTVDSDNNTAWVESGATLGELYYWVSRKSQLLGFPAGICPTVGVGGHLSGGGFGNMMRKYGLAADNVIDARIVDVDGRILDRKSMGEDLFWAIRGGGGGSFGVILAWKINLVYVPPVVTVFSLSKRLDQGATKLFGKWQYIGHKLSDDLFISLVIQTVLDQEQKRTIQVTFNSMFMGTVDQLIRTVNDSFPELGLDEKDCTEMSWIDSVLYFSVYFKGEGIDTLRERKPMPKSYFKGKSDYVKEPIPEEALEKMWKWCLEEEKLILTMMPHGGRMSEIAEAKIPYPHREGDLYSIHYLVKWEDEEVEASERYVSSIRRIHRMMTPFVSKNPREAYVNFRDLDLGTNGNAGDTTYLRAAKWGGRYFKGNFRRLAIVKGNVDPDNFFYSEQSIPPLVLCEGRLKNGNQNAQCYRDSDFGFHQSM